MKKTILLGIFAMFVIGIIVGAAYAYRGAGAGYGAYGCPCYTVDPAKAQKFYSDTLPLRQKLIQLRSELMQLYAQPNPDWNAIIKKQQERVQLKTEIQKRAHEYGLPYGGRIGMHRFGRGW